MNNAYLLLLLLVLGARIMLMPRRQRAASQIYMWCDGLEIKLFAFAGSSFVFSLRLDLNWLDFNQLRARWRRLHHFSITLNITLWGLIQKQQNILNLIRGAFDFFYDFGEFIFGWNKINFYFFNENVSLNKRCLEKKQPQNPVF